MHLFEMGEVWLTATYFFFPKKHMPTLLHSTADSGHETAAILYLDKATSLSECLCKMRKSVGETFPTRIDIASTSTIVDGPWSRVNFKGRIL